MEYDADLKNKEYGQDDSYLASLEKDSFNEFLACITDFEVKIFNSLWQISEGNSNPISLNFIFESFQRIKNIAYIGNCESAKVSCNLFKKLIFDPFPILWDSFSKNKLVINELDISLYQDNEQKLRILKNTLLMVQFSRLIVYYNDHKNLEEVVTNLEFIIECFSKNKIKNQISNVLNFVADEHFKNKISNFQFSLLENELKDIANLIQQPYF